MQPYRQGKAAAEDAYKLSSNENPFEPIPAVLAAIAASSVNRYPDGSAMALRTTLADHYSLTPENVHIGAGSASILSQLITAAAGPGDEVVYPWRSFEAYPSFVAIAGATSIQVPPRPRSDRRRGHRAHACRHRLQPQQPHRHDRHHRRVRRLHGDDPRDRARAARRGLHRIRDG
jgi:histidinol-phosphate/aromatic aminotransferase/cobyric acid decarboxylase-like protein